MNKLDKLINQIRNSNIQSALSPELIEFRQIYNSIYNDDLQKQHQLYNYPIKKYKDVFQFLNLQNIKKNTFLEKGLTERREAPPTKNGVKGERSTLIQQSITKPTIINNSKNIVLDDFEYKYYSKKELDLYSWMFFSIFCNKFLNKLTSTEQNDWIKKIKCDILVDFNKYDLYKKYSYNENFNKSDLDAIFGMNQPIPLDMIRIFGDVCNINCVRIDMKGEIKYLNICQKNRATWFIVESDNGNGWYNIIKKKNSINEFLRYNEINNIIMNDIKNIDNIVSVEKTTLDILQNYAKGLGIDPKKDGKVGKKNKLKSELIEEIKNEIAKA
jgi:hypothetical protein